MCGIRPNIYRNRRYSVLCLSYDTFHGYELWKSDGTEAGTVLVKDIWPGSQVRPPERTHRRERHVVLHRLDETHGWELWKSDGTEAGTVLVKDIWPGGDGSVPSLTDVDGTLFFTA